jgi:hypothetical protein
VTGRRTPPQPGLPATRVATSPQAGDIMGRSSGRAGGTTLALPAAMLAALLRRATRRAILPAVLVAAGVAPAVAQAERLKPRVIQRTTDPVVAEEIAPDGPAATAHSSNVIFINRCRGGCTVSPGASDAVANRSEIAVQTGTLSEFNAGDEVWQDLVDCVKFVYAPYDVVITEEDPSPARHFEIMVAGRYEEIGQRPAGGYGVGACGDVIDNSISMAFANNANSGNAAWLCYVVAQETAHNFGLDHVLEPSDPLTYLPYDGVHLFQDLNASCGEDTPRNCCAGPATQNSHEYILAEFGPADDPGPRLEIVRPAAGARVDGGFPIEAEVGPYVATVVLSIDGVEVATMTEGPFVWTAPADLAEGELVVEVAATDLRGTVSRRTVTVSHGAGGGGGGAGQGEDAPGGLIGGCATGGAGGGSLGFLVVAVAPPLQPPLAWLRRAGDAARPPPGRTGPGR